MGKHNLDRRKYGSRYRETRNITELDVLAERILADLHAAFDAHVEPPNMDFSIHVVANVLLRLQVGGLSDGFTFADAVTRHYNQPAVELIYQLTRILEEYNWINPDELTDRRFFCSVHLLGEAEYRSSCWIPGVTRML